MTSLWNVRVIDHGEVRSNAVVTIEGGRVLDIGNADQPKPADAMDLTGRTVLPGLIEPIATSRPTSIGVRGLGSTARPWRGARPRELVFVMAARPGPSSVRRLHDDPRCRV